MSSEVLLQVIVGIGLLGGIGYGVKAWYERKQLRANASSIDATATAVIVAAARELVDPLRAELAKERAEHAEEAEAERVKLVEVRAQLRNAIDDCNALRRDLAGAQSEIHAMRLEMGSLRAENLAYRKKLAEMEN
jgi:hypothetical protein